MQFYYHNLKILSLIKKFLKLYKHWIHLKNNLHILNVQSIIKTSHIMIKILLIKILVKYLIINKYIIIIK